MKDTSYGFETKIIIKSLIEAFKMLAPQVQFFNPVMFVTYIGAIVTTFYVIFEMSFSQLSIFNLQIALWLWFTVLFANFAQAIAEQRGKAQAASLRKTKIETFAKLMVEGVERKIPAL